MKIERISAYALDLPFEEGAYRCRNRTETCFASTLAEIATAAMAHLSLSTPEERRAHSCDFHNWVTVSNAEGFPPIQGGRMRAPTAPGLGVEPRKADFGPPFFHVAASGQA